MNMTKYLRLMTHSWPGCQIQTCSLWRAYRVQGTSWLTTYMSNYMSNVYVLPCRSVAHPAPGHSVPSTSLPAQDSQIVRGQHEDMPSYVLKFVLLPWNPANNMIWYLRPLMAPPKPVAFEMLSPADFGPCHQLRKLSLWYAMEVQW